MEKFSSVRVGVCEGAKRGEVCNPATCGVLFDARRWARARAGGRGRGGARSSARRSVPHVGVGEGAAACSSTVRRRGDVFLGACRRGRRLGGLNRLQVHSPASWRCLPRRVSAWAKAWWPVALSTSGGLGLLGSSVAFGSDCGEALPGVPRKAPLPERHISGALFCVFGLRVIWE